MASRKRSLASRMMPFRSKAMTACDLWIAVTCHWYSAWRSLASVTTVAYLTTLNGRPPMSKIGL